jgi:aspartate racemase
LAEAHGLEVLVPEEQDRQLVDDVIFDELCFGKTSEKSKVEYRRIVNELVEQDAEGIILGCTEIHMIVKPDDSPVPIFDTTKIHALKAVEMAIGE